MAGPGVSRPLPPATQGFRAIAEVQMFELRRRVVIRRRFTAPVLVEAGSIEVQLGPCPGSASLASARAACLKGVRGRGAPEGFWLQLVRPGRAPGSRYTAAQRRASDGVEQRSRQLWRPLDSPMPPSAGRNARGVSAWTDGPGSSAGGAASALRFPARVKASPAGPLDGVNLGR